MSRERSICKHLVGQICCQPQQPRIKRVEAHLGEKKKKEGMNGDTDRLKENNLGCMDWRERQ